MTSGWRSASGAAVEGGASRTGRYSPSCFPLYARITNLDLDITKKCNLRCVYCFKGELAGQARPSMSLEVARAAVDWLIDGSGDATYLNVNFLGGEPTMAWRSTIEKLVPYAKRRGLALGKTVQFGTTTNLTLVTQEVVEFSARWGMGWHLSIDGVPEVELGQRLGGKQALLKRVEEGAKRILAYRGGFCARATFTPANVGRMFSSYDYLRQVGFRTFGFACSTQALSVGEGEVWIAENERIIDDVLTRASRGESLDYGLLTYAFKTLAGGPSPSPCGAGRGYVMIDQQGRIWPCHRWDGAAHDVGHDDEWCLGNIFDGWFDHDLHRTLLDREAILGGPQCEQCDARKLCARGCPAENLSETGSIASPRPGHCDLTRKVMAMLRRKYDACLREGNASVLRYVDSLAERLPNVPR